MIIRLCTIEGTTPKKDKTISIRVNTQEQTPEQAAQLFALMGKMAVIAIKPDEESFLDDETKALDEIEVDLYDSTKSPSKRLRNVFWKMHEQELGRNPTDSEFKEFYKIKMEAVISHYKQRLD